ncbi:MAG TPA: M28 family peptidase [Longimicrobium sp.]
MTRTLSRLLPLLALAATPLAAQAPDPWAGLGRPRTHAPTPTTAAINPADLMTRLYAFSDDSMGGRLIASEGNRKGVEYIASELRRFGLQPAGDNGTFFQAIPYVERVMDTTATLNAGGQRLRAWVDYLPRDNGSGARSLEGVQVVYAGMMADSAHMVDSAAVAGKLVVVALGPGFVGNPPGTVSRPAITRRYRRAAGIAIAGLDDITPASLAIYRQPLQVMQGGQSPELPAYMYVTKRAAAALLGADPATLQPGATGGTVTGGPRFIERPVPISARNVVAVLPGSDPALRREYVALGAHNDHVGEGGDPVANDSIYVVNHLFRTEGADDPAPRLTAEQQAQVNGILATIRQRTGGTSARGDTIYNGADDDGSGSMGLLEIAQYFASRPHPKRSLLFVWHVGEEAGLLGSEYFTDHPTVPRESIVAQLNMDMIGRGGADDVTGSSKDGAKLHGGPGYVQLVGSRRLSTELGDLAETVNRQGNHGLNFDYAMDANGHPQNIYCRSDHYEYARYGIPIIFFTTGGHADYHQVTDEPQHIDYARLAQVANYVADLATHVANLDHRPVVDHPKPDPNGRCVQ